MNKILLSDKLTSKDCLFSRCENFANKTDENYSGDIFNKKDLLNSNELSNTISMKQLKL